MEDSDGVASVATVTDSEEEEQKAKERFRDFVKKKGVLTQFGDLKILIRWRRHSHVPQRWPFTFPATCACRWLQVLQRCWRLLVSACGVVSSKSMFYSKKKHKSPQWVWIPGAWEFSPSLKSTDDLRNDLFNVKHTQNHTCAGILHIPQHNLNDSKSQNTLTSNGS